MSWKSRIQQKFFLSPPPFGVFPRFNCKWISIRLGPKSEIDHVARVQRKQASVWPERTEKDRAASVKCWTAFAFDLNFRLWFRNSLVTWKFNCAHQHYRHVSSYGVWAAVRKKFWVDLTMNDPTSKLFQQSFFRLNFLSIATDKIFWITRTSYLHNIILDICDSSRAHLILSLSKFNFSFLLDFWELCSSIHNFCL